MASGGVSSKFTVQTVVVRRNSRMSPRRGRSLVDDHEAADVKTEDLFMFTLESAPGIRRCKQRRRRHLPASDLARLIWCPNNSDTRLVLTNPN